MKNPTAAKQAPIAPLAAFIRTVYEMHLDPLPCAGFEEARILDDFEIAALAKVNEYFSKNGKFFTLLKITAGELAAGMTSGITKQDFGRRLAVALDQKVSAHEGPFVKDLENILHAAAASTLGNWRVDPSAYCQTSGAHKAKVVVGAILTFSLIGVVSAATAGIGAVSIIALPAVVRLYRATWHPDLAAQEVAESYYKQMQDIIAKIWRLQISDAVREERHKLKLKFSGAVTAVPSALE